MSKFKTLAADAMEKALDTEFYSYDQGEDTTVREYLTELLTTLLHKGEGFSGKRPFGNCGWETNFIMPLIKAGVVAGRIEPYGDDPEELDTVGYDQNEVDDAMRQITIYALSKKS